MNPSMLPFLFLHISSVSSMPGCLWSSNRPRFTSAAWCIVMHAVNVVHMSDNKNSCFLVSVCFTRHSSFLHVFFTFFFTHSLILSSPSFHLSLHSLLHPVKPPGPAEDGDADGGDEALRALLHVLGVLEKTNINEDERSRISVFPRFRISVFFVFFFRISEISNSSKISRFHRFHRFRPSKHSTFNNHLGAIDGFLQKSVEGVQGVLIHMLHLNEGELQAFDTIDTKPTSYQCSKCLYVVYMLLCWTIVLFFLHSHVNIGWLFCAFCALCFSTLQPLRALRQVLWTTQRPRRRASSLTKFNEDRRAALSTSKRSGV